MARCRGVYLFEQDEVLNCGAQTAGAYRQIRDVGSSLFYLLLAQTWLVSPLFVRLHLAMHMHAKMR